MVNANDMSFFSKRQVVSMFVVVKQSQTWSNFLFGRKKKKKKKNPIVRCDTHTHTHTSENVQIVLPVNTTCRSWLTPMTYVLKRQVVFLCSSFNFHFAFYCNQSKCMHFAYVEYTNKAKQSQKNKKKNKKLKKINFLFEIAT